MLRTASPSGFALLPKELLFKILEQLDDEQVLECTEISFLNPIGVDILLRRNEIQDPAVYCEADVRLPERLSDPPLADTLSALLASRRRYSSIKMLHCAVRPSIGYDGMDTSIVNTIPYEDPSADPVEERAAFMFGRITEFLSQVDSLEAVHLEVAHWRWFPECFSRHLEDVLNSIIFEKGCSRLQLDTGLTSFADGHGWEIYSSVNQAPPQACTLSRILTRLTCGLFSGHHSGFTAQELQPLAHRPRLTKLQMDSLFFHPRTLSWITTLFSQSHLVDLTMSFSTAFPDNFSFIYRGLHILLLSRCFEALTLLRVTEAVLRTILPCLRLSETLKYLTVCANTSYWPPSSQSQFQATAPLPCSLEYLSISPELVYAITRIMPADRALKQVEIAYQEVSAWISIPPAINSDTRSIREFFNKIRDPTISIAVKLPMEARHVPANGILPGTPAWQPGFPTVYADSFTRALSLAQRDYAANGGNGFAAVDIFQMDCNPLKLETRESIESCVNLVHMFPQVKEVTLLGVRHSWEAWKPPPAYVLSGGTVNEIVRRVYSGCPELTSLQIGGEVYPRPEV